VPNEEDLWLIAFGRDSTEAIEDKAISVLGQTELLLGLPRPLPLDQVDAQLAPKTMPHHTDQGEEVPNVSALYRGGDDEQDRAVRSKTTV
jgi:hypothetical protein